METKSDSAPRATVPQDANGEPREDSDATWAAGRRVLREDKTEYFGRTVFFYPDVGDETVVYAASVIGVSRDVNGALDLFVPALLSVTGDTPEENDEGLRLRIRAADSQPAGSPGYTYQGDPLGPSVP